MGSWVLVRMGITCRILTCAALLVVGVYSEGDTDAPYGWSALSFLSSQTNNKRSADDAKESSLLELDDMSASESNIEAAALIASEPDPESRMNPYRRRKNKYRTKKRKNKYAANIPSQDFYEDKVYDDTYYDRDSSYQAPSSGGGGDSFNDFLNTLAAFLPIGLFLAAIPPNLIVINSRRKRGVELEENGNSLEKVFSFPFLERIEDISGFGQLSRNSECQAQLFCLLSSRGLQQEANSIQRLLGYSLNYTPQLVARILILETVLEASIAGNCEQFKCISRRN